MRAARILVIAGVLGALAWPALAYQLRGYVVSNGAHDASGSGRQLHATVGQAAIGRSTDGTRVTWHGYWSAGGSRVLSVDDGTTDATKPVEFEFGRPWPNPARAAVAFDLALPEAGAVGLDVFDAQGRRVAQVQSGAMAAGHHRLAWSGHDEAGHRVAAGVFFARLTVDGMPRGTRRIVLTP